MSLYKLEAGVVPNISFKINGLHYKRGQYEIVYRDEGSINPSVGLRKVTDNSILVNPSPYTDWRDIIDVPYASTDDLILDILNLVYSSAETKLDSIVSNTGGDGSTSIVVNKFGVNTSIEGPAEIIASFGGAYNPLVEVMDTAETFTITYNNTTDGSGQAGIQAVQITYLDENYNEQVGFHFLGNTGSDVTSFTGFGINRVVGIQYGSNRVSGNNITFTATISGTTQAQIPAGKSTTLQCLYHVGINRTLDINYLNVNVIKLAGGAQPTVGIELMSYSRVTKGEYSVKDIDIDTSKRNNLEFNLVNPITFTGREVIYLVGDTDQSGTKIFCRYSGTEKNS